VVLVKEQMQLVERVTGDLPMVFLVEIAQRHRVRQKLIQIVDATSHSFASRAIGSLAILPHG
jgi:hypothetical protein